VVYIEFYYRITISLLLDTVFMTLCSVYEVLIMYCVVLFVLSRLMLTLVLRGVLCWGGRRAVVF